MDTQQISKILKPLLVSGIYKDEDSALRDIIVDFIMKKENNYQKIISKFEKKYHCKFDEFTEKITNSATTNEEDIWMDWKAAIEMKNAWKKTLKKML